MTHDWGTIWPITAMRRVNINFTDQAYRTLTDLSAHSGHSMSQVLRDAIALKAWFDETRAQGNRVLVETRSGGIREVMSIG
jgi:hypothetical protein